MCSFPTQRCLSQRQIEQEWWWHHDCVLVLQKKKTVLQSFRFWSHPILLSRVWQWNDWTHQSTILCPNSEFARHLARLSKHDPIVLHRRIHDNLYVLRSSSSCHGDVHEFTISYGRCFCWDQFPNSFDRNQLFWATSFGVALNLTDEIPPVSCARGRPQRVDCCEWRGFNILWSVSARINLRVYPNTPIFQVVVMVLVLQSPKFLQIWTLQFQSLVRSWHDRQELIVISNIENSLVLSILCIKEQSCFLPHRFTGDVELLISHRSGKCCLFGSFPNQRLVILCELQQRVASSLWPFLFLFFCVINVNCSGSRSICSSSFAVLGVSTWFSVSYKWQVRL